MHTLLESERARLWPIADYLRTRESFYLYAAFLVDAPRIKALIEASNLTHRAMLSELWQDVQAYPALVAYIKRG